MSVPNLDEHLPWVVKVDSDEELRGVVDRCLQLGTCFAVIGGEREVRTTDRGRMALERERGRT